jgi:hypothetical protein
MVQHVQLLVMRCSSLSSRCGHSFGPQSKHWQLFPVGEWHQMWVLARAQCTEGIKIDSPRGFTAMQRLLRGRCSWVRLNWSRLGDVEQSCPKPLLSVQRSSPLPTTLFRVFWGERGPPQICITEWGALPRIASSPATGENLAQVPGAARSTGGWARPSLSWSILKLSPALQCVEVLGISRPRAMGVAQTVDRGGWRRIQQNRARERKKPRWAQTVPGRF